MKKAILSSALLLILGFSANANDEKPKKKGFFKRHINNECCVNKENCDPKDCPFDNEGNCVKKESNCNKKQEKSTTPEKK